MLLPLLVSSLLSVAAPANVAVVETGVAPDRVAAVAAAVRALLPTTAVIADSDARALYMAHGTRCGDDDECWLGLGITGDVAAVVVVTADTIAWVDVAVLRRRVARNVATADVAAALEPLVFPERFAPLRIATTPANARITVDGVPFSGDVVRVGSRDVVVRAEGYVDAHRRIEVVAAAAVEIALTPLAADPAVIVAPTTPPVLPLGLVAGGGVAVLAGITMIGIGEGQAREAIAAVRRSRRDDGSLGRAETLQFVGIAASVVGVGVGVVGGVLLATSGEAQ